MEDSVCLLLASSLHTPIDLDCIIDQNDLVKDGIISDSHITLIYDKSNALPKESILSDVEEALGTDEYKVFMDVLRDSYKFRVNHLFYLSVFNIDDSDVLVLRMKTDNELYSKLNIIYKYLMNKYDIKSDYDSYKPHLTLAYLSVGSGDKYLNHRILSNVIRDSKVGFEDLVFSKEIIDEDSNEKYDKWNITTYHALDRYFRETKVNKY